MNKQRIADIVISAWTLAEGLNKPIPTGQGVLDRALKKVIACGNFPEDFKELRFVQTRVGIRCPELNDALSWAQAADQTSDPNPSYSVTKPKPSNDVAIIILDELGIDVGEARQWGEALAAAVAEEWDHSYNDDLLPSSNAIGA